MNTCVLNIGGTRTLAADQERALRTQNMYANICACHSHESIRHKEHIVYHITLYICSRSSWASWEAASVQLSSILGPRKDTISFERAQCNTAICHLQTTTSGMCWSCSSVTCQPVVLGFFVFFNEHVTHNWSFYFPIDEKTWQLTIRWGTNRNPQHLELLGHGSEVGVLAECHLTHCNVVSGIWPWTLTCQLVPGWCHSVTSLNESQNSRRPQVQKASWVTPGRIWSKAQRVHLEKTLLLAAQNITRQETSTIFFLFSELLNNMLLPRQHKVFKIVFLTGPVASFGPLLLHIWLSYALGALGSICHICWIKLFILWRNWKCRAVNSTSLP